MEEEQAICSVLPSAALPLPTALALQEDNILELSDAFILSFLPFPFGVIHPMLRLLSSGSGFERPQVPTARREHGMEWNGSVASVELQRGHA